MKIRYAIAVLAVVLAHGEAAAQDPPRTIRDILDRMRVTWNAPTEPFRIIDNVHYVGTKGLASYLITGPDGHVLIDTVMPEATDQIKANVAKLGFKLGDIKLMLNTHAHLDHAGGFAELKREIGATLILGAADRRLMEKGVYPGAEDVGALHFPAASVDRTVVDGDVVALGPIRLTAHATPGHSPGCTTWTMPVVEAGRTHKIIFFCSGTVAGNRLAPDPTYPGIVADYQRTFASAPAIEGDILLAPHPEMYAMEAKRARLGEGPNPFVVPGEFQGYLGKLKGEFEANLARQQAGAGR